MRVLQVIKDLDEGGAQVVVRHLVEELTAAGHEVAVAAMPGRLSPDFTVPQYGLPMTGADPRLLPEGVRALRTAISDFRPDVVHAHNPGTMPVTSLATGRGRLVPALATLHGSPAEQYRANARLATVAGLLTVACGPAVAQQMADAGAPVSATVINGVQVRPQRTRTQTRADLGIDEDEFVVLQVGRLVHQKHPELAVQAFARSGVPGFLLLAGAGDLDAAVREVARQERVADRVRLLGPRPDAADLMAAADVVQLSSRFEGLPLVLLEAMSLGAVVVGVRAPGVTELIRDGADGLLPERSVDGLANALHRLHGDTTLRERLATGAKKRSAEFTAARMASDYADLYAQLA
ncbi:glycosyltransferase family 4 protein [Arsenicicoccus piscis]|uniref:glycosyltransferase family 4 protein n=1 Tax=Arsenicicoccus piscis TaxID=673954 RepID=UPI001F4C74DE|nr:glycosyltransferase family 4 protein [Arsenicicoccus piscis]MCH8628055.1 glycosyltransferase family 4 protein [Arsenicicoccus piscis]